MTEEAKKLLNQAEQQIKTVKGYSQTPKEILQTYSKFLGKAKDCRQKCKKMKTFIGVIRQAIFTLKFIPGAGMIPKVLDKALQMLVKSLKKADKIFKRINNCTKNHKSKIDQSLKNVKRQEQAFTKLEKTIKKCRQSIEKGEKAFCQEDAQEQVEHVQNHYLPIYQENLNLVKDFKQPLDKYISKLNYVNDCIYNLESYLSPFSGMLTSFNDTYLGMKEYKAFSIITDYVEWAGASVDYVVDQVLYQTGLQAKLDQLNQMINPLADAIDDALGITDFCDKIDKEHLFHSLMICLDDIDNMFHFTAQIFEGTDLGYKESSLGSINFDEYSFGSEDIGNCDDPASQKKEEIMEYAGEVIEKTFKWNSGLNIKTPTTVAEMRRLVMKIMAEMSSLSGIDGFILQAYSEWQYAGFYWWNYQRCGYRRNGTWYYLYDGSGQKFDWNSDMIYDNTCTYKITK